MVLGDEDAVVVAAVATTTTTLMLTMMTLYFSRRGEMIDDKYTVCRMVVPRNERWISRERVVVVVVVVVVESLGDLRGSIIVF